MEINRRVDYSKVFKEIFKRKRTYVKTLAITFVLSCIWIFPKPRYYTCDVMLAPEMSTEEADGTLSSIASSFGLSLGGGGNDAIYPLLYPDLFASPDFIADILSIRITSKDDEGNIIDTDYYNYLKKYQKKNWLTYPFVKGMDFLGSLFSDKVTEKNVTAAQLNPKSLSKKDYQLFEKVTELVTCKVDKKTDVVTIVVQDQDRFVCAQMADSVKNHLQEFITRYRTAKVRSDCAYYQLIADSAKYEYDMAVERYSIYTDKNRDVILQTYISERDKLENELQLKYTAYNTIQSQLMAAKAKVQEHTPVFVTLKSASAPVKPAGPKRMIFVASMLVLVFIGTSIYVLRDILKESI